MVADTMHDSDEERLGDGEHRTIVRVGDTVHRPVGWWTPAVHDLLGHLESLGFPYSPRVRGFDAQGREILSFIPGEAGAAGWAKIVSDDGLRRFARLLREYHEAIADYRPPADAEWANINGSVQSGEIVCHGDFGPWNIVWQGETPVGIVDWDMAMPAPPRFDVLYALEYAAPFRDDDTCTRWHGFPQPPGRKQRITVFTREYGVSDFDDVASAVATMQRQVKGFVARLAARGLQPQAGWVAAGHLEECEQRARWTEANRARLE